MTPEDIEHLFAGVEVVAPEDAAVAAGDEAGEAASSLAAQLQPVLDSLRELWESGSLRLDEAAQAVANGSRNESWRKPLGESGILDFFLSLLATEQALRPALLLQILRLMGNACADTDVNRQRVIDASVLPKLVALLDQDAILPIVLVVLNNLCNDHEPSQKAAYIAGLNPELVSILASPRAEQARPYFHIIFRLLEELSTQEPEANYVHPATPFILLKLALESADAGDLEDFFGPTPVALTYLSHQQFQDSFVKTPGAVALLLRAFSVVTDDLGPTGSDDEPAAVADEDEPAAVADEDDQKRLKKVQSVFVQAIADISAHDAFATSYPLDSDEVHTLVKWLASSPSTPVAKPTAACLALGNLARSDDVCTKLVQDSGLQVHKPLAALLAAAAADAQLLHSSLSFLKNLAIPAGNKAVLGAETGLLDDGALPRLWALTVQPQVQFAAVSLTRLLLVQCTPNVGRILERTLSPGEDGKKAPTKLNALLAAFKGSEQEPTKVEVARAVLAVCRVLHSAASTDEVSELLSSLILTEHTASSDAPPAETLPSSERLLEAYYALHADGLAAAVLHLAAQTKFPTLRSELWFVLALIARSSRAGAIFVSRAVLGRYEFLSELTRVVTGDNMVEGREEEMAAAAAVTDADSKQQDSTPSPAAAVTGGNAAEQTITAVPSVKLELEPQQVGAQAAAGLAKVDRENCIVLVHELVRQVSPQGLGSPMVAEVLKKIIQTTPSLLKTEASN
ncbi:importin subunit alpha-6/7 [Microdochium nivale]|nr:importin subunit alpha-6/7 [Microdochium nivale]